ncbi:MAG: hypothetical protein ACOCP4_07755, partial [Candidatus Woesearchaeota archaeon]
MKIAYISSSVIPSKTASSIHVMKMISGFCKNGHEIPLMAPRNIVKMEKDVSNIFSFYKVREIFELIHLSKMKFPGKSNIYAFFAAFKAFKLKADLVYCRSITGCFFAIKFGLPVILELHSAEDIGNILKTFFLKSIFRSRQLKKIVVITNTLKHYYEKKYPDISNFLFVAPDGADEIDLNAVRSKKVRVKDKLNVGYTGHLYPGKGMEIISQLV